MTRHKKIASKKDYSVGYGRPPESGRFRPGTSGNPKGRKKGARSISDQLERLLFSKIQVAENGVTKYLSYQEIILRKLVNNAAKGDIKSMECILRLRNLHQEQIDSGMNSATDPADDQAILMDFLKQNALEIEQFVNPNVDSDNEALSILSSKPGRKSDQT